MNNPIITIIAAMDEKRGIGKNNKLLWDIPEDLKHFRETTRGHACIMGRKTFESIGHPLPDRPNIIVTRNVGYRADGTYTEPSVEKAIEHARRLEKEEIFVIGGSQIYEQALPHTSKLNLTFVEGVYDADAFFPRFEHMFTETGERIHRHENGYRYSFATFARK